MRKSKLFILAFAVSIFPTILRSYSVLGKERANTANKQTIFNDVHFHLTKYIQKGIKMIYFLKIMGSNVGRVAIFGIPLQQKWDYFVDGNRPPDYYLLSDTELYYYSFVDAAIAQEYLKLSPEQQRRFDPMITGFNPTVRIGNYQRLFDQARTKVRAWEKTQASKTGRKEPQRSLNALLPSG
jgi:hypothetical protein